MRIQLFLGAFLSTCFILALLQNVLVWSEGQ